MHMTIYHRLGSGAMVLACMLSASCGPEGAPPGSAPAASAGQKDEVVALLKQSFADDVAWDKRVRMQSDRIGPWQAKSVKDMYAKYPVRYASERLIAKGRAAVGALLEISGDAKYADLHFAAWMALAKVDRPEYLKQLYQAGLDKRLSPENVAALVEGYLPVRPSRPFLEKDKVMEWLGSQLAKKSQDEIVLEMLDDFLAAEFRMAAPIPTCRTSVCYDG